MQGEESSSMVIIVDDDKNISELLTFNLTSEGFAVHTYQRAADVDLDMVRQVRLVIADAMNQSFTGLDLTKKIKADPDTESVPVIICSALEGEDAVIDAFDAGADDYVTKPFSLREMIARIKAILRRHPVNPKRIVQTSHTLAIPGSKLMIDLETQRTTEDGMLVPLTKTEYAILVFLIKNINTYFTRNDIFTQIWNDDEGANPRVVDTNISRLRKKLGESGKFIVNRYGLGYAVFDKLNQ